MTNPCTRAEMMLSTSQVSDRASSLVMRSPSWIKNIARCLNCLKAMQLIAGHPSKDDAEESCNLVNSSACWTQQGMTRHLRSALAFLRWLVTHGQTFKCTGPLYHIGIAFQYLENRVLAIPPESDIEAVPTQPQIGKRHVR